MAYSDNFPAVRPVFQADFANGGKIDPRATFSRSDTPPTYAAPSAVHYMSNEKHLSSENLLLQSSDFDTTWGPQGLTSITGGQADPSGGTGGFTLLENTATIFHRITQSLTVTGELAFTVYAKRTSGTRYLNLTIAESGAQHSAGLATFDLAGGATHTANGSSSGLTNLSATQTASGNGYYKCVFYATATTTVRVDISFSDVATPASNNYGLVSYTGDGTSSIDVAFASLSTVGATDYNATTTSIHRQYASTLKSVSTAGQPRFEYGIDGQSMGCLIESQSTNLVTRSHELDNAGWTKGALNVDANAAISVDGTLAADLLMPTTASGAHYALTGVSTTASSTYTASAYVKAAGYSKIRLFFYQASSPNTHEADATFTLSGSGSVTTLVGSSTITAVGGGYYRISVTGVAGTSNSNIQIRPANDAGSDNFAGDGYSGILCTGVQFELGSFASSLVSTSGASATRAADSLSVATADIGYTGGPVTLVADTTTSATDNYRQALSILTNSQNQVTLYGNSNNNRLGYVQSGSQSSTLTQTSANGISALSFGVNDIAATRNGAAPVTDTSQALPDVSGGTLKIGGSGTNQILNGHVKRVAIYNEALSDTNLQALTS